MFEDKTVDNIHNKMLSNIDDSYAKNVGYPTYDITRSFAIQEAIIYSAMKLIMNKLDVDKLQGDELDKYVRQRKGLLRKLKTNAKGILTVNGNGKINLGDLFSTQTGIKFRSLESVNVNGTADIKIESLEGGSIGIVGSNSIVQFPITIQGIISCINKSPTYDGFQEESDDSLRSRYYDALQKPKTGSNKYSYMGWAKAVNGVGDAKVLGLWNGPNTVKVVIIDSNKQPANNELVKRVQDYIDPKGIYDSITNTWSTWGIGEGEAPMGAYCTVISAMIKDINIDVDVQEDNNYTLQDVTNNIKTNLTNYFKEIAFKQDFVSYAKIGSLILNTEGVKDYQTLKVNDGTININVGNEEVAVLGNVVII